MKAFSWVTCVLGLWLIVAANMFTYSTYERPATVQEVALGVTIAVLSCWAAIGRTKPILGWLIALAGLATLAGPAMVDYRGLTAARSNDLVVGFAVLLLGCASAITGHRARAASHA